MDRFDGTAARQLLLVDEAEHPIAWREAQPPPRPNLRFAEGHLRRAGQTPATSADRRSASR